MRRFKTVGALVLAAGLVASPLTASATDPNVDEVTGLQYSSTLPGTAQFIGTAKNVAGAAFPNARVELIAWPSNAVLSGLAYDADVPTKVVAVDRTSSSGSFKLTPSVTSLYPYASAEGFVDFEVVVFADGYQSSQFLESTPVPSNPNARSAEASAATLSTSLGTFTMSASTDTHANSTGDATLAPDPLKFSSCGWRKRDSAGAKWVAVGAAYVKKTGITAKFTYRTNSESKLGIAVRMGGSAGAWRASGTSTVTVDSTDGFPLLTGNASRRWRTQWEYFNFKRRCGQEEMVRAVNFIGGTSSVSLSGTPSTVGLCAQYEAGSDKEKTNGTASTFTGGVDLGPAIGIDVNAQSNYSSNTKIFIDFTSAATLCGTTGTPGGNSSGTLVVKP
ncbi:hypothetical protein LJR045_002936 [Microbacterium sp. LjRoot45]|uniref:hypothetical protein n=1 Tax=Microbacterium sp. LjRoot45 TaxID=3342329 RepID=UPI003ECE3A68